LSNPSKRSAVAMRQRLALLRALSRSGATARWSCEGPVANRRLEVRSGSDKNAKTSFRAPAQMIAELASLGIIAGQDDRPTVTPAGLAWLRRQLASDDPFQEQHRATRYRQLAGSKGSMQRVRINDAESPLAWLAHRKDRDGVALLDGAQFDAGERLRRDYTFAALVPSVTANWSSVGGSGGSCRAAAPAAAMRDDVLAAKDRVHRAMVAVGPELGRMLIDVCCLLKGIEAAELGQRLPQRSGKVVLQLALTALARHYGLLTEQSRPHGEASIQHWGAWDFRPVL